MKVFDKLQTAEYLKRRREMDTKSKLQTKQKNVNENAKFWFELPSAY